MTDFKKLRDILNGSGMSIKHYAKGKVSVTDSSFKGASLSALQEAQDFLAESIKDDTKAFARKLGIQQLDSVEDVHKRAKASVSAVAECITGGNRNVKKLHEAFRMTAQRDSIINPRWSNSNFVDPQKANIALPNIYISPYEAASLYSQKGIFENVINKKSKSILLNGMRIENPYLTVKQLEKINENLNYKNFQDVVSDSARDSLCFGGALVFPMFRKDNPVTASLPLSALLKLGVLKKNCIDYFVRLDRWNTFIIPPYNPTQKDFYRPEKYTVPFLGSDVHHTRCARVVTAEQAGYWGQIINQGWGISDFCGYLQSGLNYKVAVQSLPLMIQQMSILARTINIDGVLATEGSNALGNFDTEGTIKVREASPDNPVTLEVLGELKSIDRNFSQVPELIKLLRQDFASDAEIPEPLLFSSEKGNFASGDDTQGNLAKQWESIKMIHKDIESQYTQLAKILVIDTLGTEDDLIKILPYTKLKFDEPVIANATERAQIGKMYSESVFNLVSAQIPVDISVEMASKNMSKDMEISSDVLDRLRAIQDRVDKRDTERFEMEMAVQENSIEEGKERASGMSSSGGEDKETKGVSPAEEQREKALGDKKEHGYSRLEQKSHEKARLGESKRSEKIAKQKNKGV